MTVGAALALVSAGPAAADNHKHAICHATKSENNPYVLNEPAKSGDLQGHLGNGHQDGEDIIPPFEFEGRTYSQNWDAEGQAIFRNGCQPVTTTPTTTTAAGTSVTTTTQTTTPTTGTSVSKTTQTTTPSTGTSVSSTTQTTTTHTTTATTTATQTTTQAAPVVPTQAKTTPAQRTAAATTPARRTAGPIPGAVAAGTNEAASWQLPVGGALILLGAVGMTTTVLRRKSARH